MTKVCFSTLLIVGIIVKPAPVHAGFFSVLRDSVVSKVLGSETQAAEVAPLPESNHNSQTLPLPESSINPDLKSVGESEAFTIVSDEALLSNNSPFGNDNGDLEKYASTEKISVYVVKKGDTIEGISKKLKVSKDTIISSNADLKKSDLLKIGQSLVILAIKPSSSMEKVDTSPISEKVVSDSVTAKKKEDTSVKPDESKKKIVENPVIKKDVVKKEEKVAEIQTPVLVTLPQTATVQNPITTSLEEESVEVEVNVVPEEPSISVIPPSVGQPNGTINGSYIWPFPKGLGRISQGLHADNAYDFAAPKGTPIYAIQSGTVLISHPTGYNGGYGLYVVINFDDGRQAIFGHMSKVVSKTGDTVKQGDIIGYVGSTGRSTGPHVHIGFHGDMSNPYKGLKVNSTTIIDND